MGLLSDMAVGSEQRLVEARAVVSDAELRRRCAALPSLPRLRLSADGFDLIAELKLRSPALGDLSARTLDPVARLRGYAEAGAAICSILTESSRFGGEVRRNVEIVAVECLEQDKQALLRRGVEHRDETLAPDHAHDQQHAAGPVCPRLEHLVRIDQEILAHRRHAVRRERRCGLSQVREVAVEPRGLGQDRADRCARLRVTAQPCDRIYRLRGEIAQRG